MSDEIRCKRIIEGKTYNTETSVCLGHVVEPDDIPFDEALFKTRHGAYFLYVSNHTDLSETLIPLTPEQAQGWMEKHCRAEAIEKEFGAMPEAGDSEARLTVRIPETLRRRIVAIAEGRKQSLNAWIQRALERAAATAESTPETPTVRPPTR